MKLRLGHTIRWQIELLEREVQRLRLLDQADIEFEVPDQDGQPPTPAARVAELDAIQRKLKPGSVRALLEFAINVGAIAHQAGCPEYLAIPTWLRAVVVGAWTEDVECICELVQPQPVRSYNHTRGDSMMTPCPLCQPQRARSSDCPRCALMDIVRAQGVRGGQGVH